MANQIHLDLLKQSIDIWYKWRLEHQGIQPDLSGADLSGARLRGAYLKEADLSGADLREAELEGADLSNTRLNGAILSRAYLNDAYLKGASLNKAKLIETRLIGSYLGGAKLIGADLSGAYLNAANFSEADLSDVNLSSAILVETNLTGANLTQCSIYGISVWGVNLEGARQDSLVITPPYEPTITIDNLEVAQFIYLLINNPKIRDVIDTIAKKAVLILGRFTSERKSALEAIRTSLRTRGYLPILFDFEKPDSQDLTGTVSTLANISRFIIVDLTDPSCSPYEIGLIAPYMKPIKPLFQPSKAAKHEFAMFQDLRKRYSWVLSVYNYKDQENLLASMQEKVIVPAEKKVQMLEKKKRQ
jgi:hypothetical protein